MHRKIFHPVKRHLKIEHEAEDRWADAVASTWAMFSGYAREKNVGVYRLGGIHDDEQADQTDRAMEVSLAECRAEDPEEKWNSAIDLERWVGVQTFQDQAILTGKMEGRSTKNVAHELHVPGHEAHVCIALGDGWPAHREATGHPRPQQRDHHRAVRPPAA